MAVIMVMAASRRVMGRFVIPVRLKVMGWHGDGDHAMRLRRRICDMEISEHSACRWDRRAENTICDPKSNYRYAKITQDVKELAVAFTTDNAVRLQRILLPLSDACFQERAPGRKSYDETLSHALTSGRNRRGGGFAHAHSPPAVLAWAAKRRWIRLVMLLVATIISAKASKTITDFALSELIADKLPFTQVD